MRNSLIVIVRSPDSLALPHTEGPRDFETLSSQTLALAANYGVDELSAESSCPCPFANGQTFPSKIVNRGDAGFTFCQCWRLHAWSKYAYFFNIFVAKVVLSRGIKVFRERASDLLFSEYHWL
jgi:hypothetical protein